QTNRGLIWALAGENIFMIKKISSLFFFIFCCWGGVAHADENTNSNVTRVQILCKSNPSARIILNVNNVSKKIAAEFINNDSVAVFDQDDRSGQKIDDDLFVRDIYSENRKVVLGLVFSSRDSQIKAAVLKPVEASQSMTMLKSCHQEVLH
ncbi:hypothetical protein MLT30_23855, partial [Escherichia coli]|nr:hypothetical protein [Escherichia coli]